MMGGNSGFLTDGGSRFITLCEGGDLTNLVGTATRIAGENKLVGSVARLPTAGEHPWPQDKPAPFLEQDDLPIGIVAGLVGELEPKDPLDSLQAVSTAGEHPERVAEVIAFLNLNGRKPQDTMAPSEPGFHLAQGALPGADHADKKRVAIGEGIESISKLAPPKCRLFLAPLDPVEVVCVATDTVFLSRLKNRDRGSVGPAMGFCPRNKATVLPALHTGVIP